MSGNYRSEQRKNTVLKSIRDYVDSLEEMDEDYEEQEDVQATDFLIRLGALNPDGSCSSNFYGGC